MGTVSILRPGRRTAPGSPATSATALDAASGDPLADLLHRTSLGDEDAFAALYDAVASSVYGMILRVLRDPAQTEEVAQEVMVDLWRQASRYDPQRGSARAWMLTIAHRRAVDRVRSAQSSSDREDRAGRLGQDREFDEVAEAVETRMEAQQVRRALQVLTDLQREAVTLAYYGGYTHREVSELLEVPLGTVKTRLRDGLIRLRDEMGVGA